MFVQTSSERRAAFQEMSLSAAAGSDNTPVVVRRCVFCLLMFVQTSERHAAFREVRSLRWPAAVASAGLGGLAAEPLGGGQARGHVDTPVVVRRFVFLPAHVRADVV